MAKQKSMKMKDIIDQAEKLREKEIYAWIGSFIDGGEDMDAYWQNSLKELFNSHISTYTKDLLQSVVELSDKIESEHEHTEFDEWRAFKGFRNTLTDIIKELK